MKSILICVLCVLCVGPSPAQQIRVPTEKKAIAIKGAKVHPFRPHETPAPSGKASTEFIPYVTPFSIVLFPAKVERKLPPDFMVPVYLENVDQPYEIIGTVVVRDISGLNSRGSQITDHDSRSLALRSAASTAWLHGADAILLQPLPPMRVGYYMAAVAVRFSWRL